MTDGISQEDALQFLATAPVAHLGVVADGKPYVTPMSFVVDGGRILFRTQPGRKLEAIRENPAVCIEVSTLDVASGDWVSVIVTGTATVKDDQATGELAVARLLEKYAAQIGSPFGRSGLQPLASFPHVVEVSIDEVTGASSGGGLLPRIRPGRL